VGLGEEALGGSEGDPGVTEEFVLELAGGPGGVPDGCLDDVAVFSDHGGGDFGGDVRKVGQAVFSAPCEGGESQLIGGKRAAAMDGKGGQGAGAEVRDEIPDACVRGVVDDHAEGSVGGRVLCEHDDGVVEGAVAKGRGGKQELAL